MRLLTHNTLRNNTAAAKGKGFPLKITVAEIKVDENVAPLVESRKAFLRGILPTLDWSALVQVSILLVLILFLSHGLCSNDTAHILHSTSVIFILVPSKCTGRS